MVRRRFFRAVSNHESPDGSSFERALLRMRAQVFDSAFFETNVALRLSNSSTFTPFLRMM
jgi:hypothetical protein